MIMRHWGYGVLYKDKVFLMHKKESRPVSGSALLIGYEL